MPRYKYTQESGADFKVVDPDKADGQEDTNQVRQVVDDLGNLLGHSKRDDLYPKDGTTGGKLAIPESQLNISNIVFCSDYANPDDAIDAIGSANKTLVVTEAETCDTNFTVPANVTVKFERGGKWTINNEVTVTFNGQIDAGLWQIFEYVGTGTIDGNPLVDRAYPQWWINAGDGSGTEWTSPSNTAGIQEALDFCNRVFLPSGTYRTKTTIHLSNYQVLSGESKSGTYIRAYAFSAAEPVIQNVAGQNDGIVIEDLKIQNYLGSSTDIIHFTDGGFEFNHLLIKSSNRHGIYLEDCWYAKISNIQVTYSGEIGIHLDQCNGTLLDHVFISNSGYKGVDSTTPYGIYDYCGRADSFIGCSMEGSTGNTEGVGIRLQGAKSALVEGCYIEANTGYGIYIDYQNVVSNGSNISIISNYITSSDTVYGIYIKKGTLINVSNNHITGNKSIEILAAATNIKLENNTAAEINNASASVLMVTGKTLTSPILLTPSIHGLYHYKGSVVASTNYDIAEVDQNAHYVVEIITSNANTVDTGDRVKYWRAIIWTGNFNAGQMQSVVLDDVGTQITITVSVEGTKVRIAISASTTLIGKGAMIIRSTSKVLL